MTAKNKSAPKKAAKEKPQKQRFIEAAREHECDETGEALERVFKKIVPPSKGRRAES